MQCSCSAMHGCDYDVDAMSDGSSAPSGSAVCVLRQRWMAPCRPLSLPCGMWMPTHTCAGPMTAQTHVMGAVRAHNPGRNWTMGQAAEGHTSGGGSAIFRLLLTLPALPPPLLPPPPPRLPSVTGQHHGLRCAAPAAAAAAATRAAAAAAVRRWIARGSCAAPAAPPYTSAARHEVLMSTHNSYVFS
jgi:hypothetical protein